MARFKEVDLVCRDEGSALVVIAFYALDDIAIGLPFGVDRQIAADQSNVAET